MSGSVQGSTRVHVNLISSFEAVRRLCVDVRVLATTTQALEQLSYRNYQLGNSPTGNYTPYRAIFLYRQ